MTLDVETPPPPSLRDPENPGDYDAVDEVENRTGEEGRRSALAEFLQDGAWEDAFADWAGRVDLTAEEFEVVRDLGLIDRFDFYWNVSDEDVGYRAPTVPHDLPAPYDQRLDEDDVEYIDEGLDELGRTVSEVLENDYIHRGSEEFGYDWE